MAQPEFFFPQSLEDLANFLGDTFYPNGGFDAEKIRNVVQWILQREVDDNEVVFILEKFYQRVQENNPDTK